MTRTKNHTAPLPDWLGAFPELGRLVDPTWLAAVHAAKEASIPARSIVMRKGAPCEHCQLLAHGTLRVYEVAECGREIVLYRVHAGEMCILNVTNLLDESAYPVEVVTEDDACLISIPMHHFHQVMAHSADFRGFVMATLARRMNDMMRLVERVTFQRLDLRLASQLYQRFERGNMSPLTVTHQELARDLGSSREVISRLLKEFERLGCIRLHRGQIELLSRETLKRLT